MSNLNSQYDADWILSRQEKKRAAKACILPLFGINFCPDRPTEKHVGSFCGEIEQSFPVKGILCSLFEMETICFVDKVFGTLQGVRKGE
ncbi:MAG: hypothetical protein D3908_11715 [Candidatus Electrothrix sp. AUS4]|nr:hypothetical protein [Candidatus Electrothrix sp. AUS4]